MELESKQNICNCNNELRDSVLGNRLILNKIMTFLPVKTLKSTRQVSKLWNEVSFNYLRTQAWVILSFNEKSTKYIGKFLKIAGTPLLSNIGEQFDCLYNNFVIEGFVHHVLASSSNLLKTIELFDMFSEHMHRLHFKNWQFKVNDYMWTKLLTSQWAPNLNTLILDRCIFSNEGNELIAESPNLGFGLRFRSTIGNERIYRNRIKCFTYIPHPISSEVSPMQNFSELWNMFPKLESLRMTDLKNREITEFLQASSHTPKNRLRHLDIFGEESYSVRKVPKIILTLFCETALPLTVLTIDIGELIEEYELRLILNTFKKTLEKLFIWRGLLAQRLDGFPYNIPLPQLKELTVPENVLANLAFVNKTPRLRILKIAQCDDDPVPYKTDICTNYTKLEKDYFLENPCRSVVNLTIQYATHEVDDVQFLGKVFPNVMFLTAFFSDRKKRHVYETMKLL